MLEAYIESRCNERGRRVGCSMKRDKASEDGQSGLCGCLAGGGCLTVFYKGGARYYCWGRRAVQMWLSRVSAGPCWHKDLLETYMLLYAWILRLQISLRTLSSTGLICALRSHW